jgi:hypothetical protein
VEVAVRAEEEEEEEEDSEDEEGNELVERAQHEVNRQRWREEK